MSAALRLSLIQLAVSDADPGRNLARATALIESAPAADLYLLPELWTTGYAHDAWPQAARRDSPAVLQALGSLARRVNASIGGSMVAVGPNGGLANRFTLVNPSGQVVAEYDKAHLFAPMGECVHLQPGTRRIRTPVGPFTAALSICYDLRFPDMYRLDALDGADLFLVVSAWPAERIEVMQTLARARAIEDQAFLVLCNRTGDGADGTRFGGGSSVLGPDGAVLATAGTDETVITATIERSAVQSIRTALPLLTQRSAGIDWSN